MVYVNRRLLPDLFESLRNKQIAEGMPEDLLEGLFVSVRLKVHVVSPLTDELVSGERYKWIEGRGPLWSECYLHG